MLPEVEKLLILQERDSRIADIRFAVASIPKELAAREAELGVLRKALETKKSRAREIEAECKTLENKVLSLKERITKCKTQQLQTRKNEEYAALAHEIESAEKQISILEDRELELMEELDSLQPMLHEADAAFREGAKKNTEQIAGIEKKRATLSAQLAELEETRSKLTQGLDEELLNLYERLFRSKGGSAVVELVQCICTGCHMRVPQHIVVETRSGKSIVQCPHCGRILFYQG